MSQFPLLTICHAEEYKMNHIIYKSISMPEPVSGVVRCPKWHIILQICTIKM